MERAIIFNIASSVSVPPNYSSWLLFARDRVTLEILFFVYEDLNDSYELGRKVYG